MVSDLGTITQRLVTALHPERIYLFGSVARGDAGPDSDYDLLVVLPDEAPDDLQDNELPYRVLRGTGTAVDVVVMTRNQFERRLAIPASLPAIATREGRLLYAA